MNSSFTALRNQWAQMSRSEHNIMLGILALGAFLRVFRLDIFEFKADELEGITRGLAVPAQHWWIEHGAWSSAHIPFGPAFSYIMGLFTSVSQDPYTLTGFVVAANIVVLVLSVLFFAEFSRDRKQFFLCVALFSLSPYLIIFSRKIWQPNLLLLFVIPLVLMIAKVRRDPRLFLPIGLFSSIVVQLHHSGIFYLPLLICFAAATEYGRRTMEDGRLRTDFDGFEDEGRSEVVSRPAGIRSPSSVNARPAIRHRVVALWAAGGFMVFVVLLIPYLSFLFHHFRQSGITQWVAGGSSHLCLQGALKWGLFTGTGSDFWRYVFSGKASEWNWPVVPFPGALLIFCYLLIVPFLLGLFKYVQSAVGFFRGWSANQAKQPVPIELLCPLSIMYLFLVYCFVLDHGRPHHYTIIVPFLILAISKGILILLDLGKRLKTAVRVLLCLALVSYALQYPFVLLYVNANNGSTGEYGICYREQRNVAKKIAFQAGREQIRINPVTVFDDSFSALRKAELQETIAYICKTEFGADVLFYANPEPGVRALKLLKTGTKLHLDFE